MDKQREISRQSMLKLFEENFVAAVFQEKTDTMMRITDFEAIRNEIEDEYFTKNQGIAHYSAAIKYLSKKIQACTADNILFAPIEEYICAKENIVVTKIAKENAPTKAVTLKKKTRAKGAKQKATDNASTKAGHVECNSSTLCKKCRIMRRIDRPTFKLPKRSEKTEKRTPKGKQEIKLKISSKKEAKKQTKKEVKKEVSGPNYASYVESIEAVVNELKDVMKPQLLSNTQVQPKNRLTHNDHQYSRITFYGSGDASQTKTPATAVKNEPKTVQKRYTTPKKFNGAATFVPSPTPKIQVARPMPMIYRLKQKNDLQQPSAAYFDSSITSPSTHAACYSNNS